MIVGGYRGLAIAALLTLATPATAFAADCDAANGKIEKTICGNEDMRALDDRIDKRYAALVMEMDEEGAAALREDQQWYLSARDEALTWLDEDRDGALEKIAAHAAAQGEVVDGKNQDDWEKIWSEVLHSWLEARAFVLEAMVAHPDAGLAGLWTNAGGGEVLVTANEDGSLSLLAHVDETLFGRWACRARGRAAGPDGADAHFVDPDVAGWSIMARREGAVLRVAERRDDGRVAASPWCGLNGGIKGRYFQISIPLRKLATTP